MSIKSLYTNVHSSFTHNSQKLEIIQISICGISEHLNITKQCKKGTTDRCNNMDKYHRYYAKRKKPNTKIHTVWFHFYETRKDKSNY